MLNIFKKKAQTLLGVDLNPAAIRLVELSREEGCYTVENYAIMALPYGAIVERQVVQAEIVAQILKQLINQTRPRVKQAAMALAGAAVITKTIEMDAGLNEDELASVLRLEAQQHIPYSMEDVAIDFIVQPKEEQAADKVSVLLAASREENINVRENILSLAGLRAKVIEIEGHALARACRFVEQHSGIATDGSVLAVIDVGVDSLTLNILQHGFLVYSREQTFATELIAQLQQHCFRSTSAEAVPAKIAQGTIFTDLMGVKTHILEHITRAFQFFYGTSHYSSVDCIIVSGVTLLLAGLESAVQSQFNTPTVLANPFVNMKLSKKLDESRLAIDAPALLVACGLAMREEG